MNRMLEIVVWFVVCSLVLIDILIIMGQLIDYTEGAEAAENKLPPHRHSEGIDPPAHFKKELEKCTRTWDSGDLWRYCGGGSFPWNYNIIKKGLCADTVLDSDRFGDGKWTNNSVSHDQSNYSNNARRIAGAETQKWPRQWTFDLFLVTIEWV